MAGRIYVTGDCHAELYKLRADNIDSKISFDKDDYVIICGDFGVIWNHSECDAERDLLDFLENQPYTTLFIDGNHENFDRLYNYPVTRWKGGNVHLIRPSVIHLMRGQVFEIAGKKLFSFGGAQSHDISGGILDRKDPEFLIKKLKADIEYEPYRIKNETWWEQELPSKQEMWEGMKNLAAHDYKVDYIFSHCCSSETQDILDGGTGLFKSDYLTDYFDDIKDKCAFTKWYFGHYHEDANVSENEVLLYDQVVVLGENVSE